MPDVPTIYGSFSDSISFWKISNIDRNAKTSSKFHKFCGNEINTI